ncbi:MAG: ExeM/NucH family extracellular endonuclease [Thermoanaerobaculia bacterium]
MKPSYLRIASCTAVFALLVSAAPMSGQCVSLTTLGSAATQDFDTLSNVAGSTTNNLTITGWFLTESGGGARDNEQYAVDTGASGTGDTYSFGVAAATDRALGGLRSGTLIPIIGACYTNNTGATIGSLAVAYTGEEWRLGTAARTDQLTFEYSTTATDLVTGTWTNVAALNFVTPDTATTGAKNGNAAADRTALSSTIPALSIANGATFWIRWTDIDATGADDGLSVDDFSLTPNGTVVLPNLTVNDVSLNEGNAGTTSFIFTVSLSAPAGAGGVTFDIATADVTAVAPGDYTAKSLTGQTIPAGSSTYSFTVLVNGDLTPEINDTFVVNVTNATGANLTDPQGLGTIVNDDAAPNLTIDDVSLNEGNAGTTTFTFTVSLSTPAPAGGTTFDIATANSTAVAPGDYTAKSLTGQTIPAGSSTYIFDVLVNGDVTPETNETFFVNVTNVTNAIPIDVQGLGTIQNDDITRIHDVQGNGAATPIPGATVTVEGIVIAEFQGSPANVKLGGFFLQEEDADADADPATSEGIFVFCGACPTPVVEGQRVSATGTVSEFNALTEITASTAGSVIITNAGNNLAQVTPSPITLPVVGVINDFYETRESMLVTFTAPLTVTEYFELGRYGQIELAQGGRPVQFTEANAPNAAGYTASLDTLARRTITLDDDNNRQESYLTSTGGPADGMQFIYHPRANGGFSVGTQGTDFFRGGDQVTTLTGVLHWSFPGFGLDTWRIRPTAANPVTFTVANPRPATSPVVGGSIKAAGMNLLNYFTTIDTTSSNSSGPCGPGGTLDCRGADSVAELNRQRARAATVICSINADVYGFMELENTTASATITDLLGAVNASCGGTKPYAFVNTGGTLGTDAIRVQLIYRTGILSPFGPALVDLSAVHNRPPTAQTFDVVDATNPAVGQRFTVIANHSKSKGCPGTGADADAGDGQSCYAFARNNQANALLTWITNTVIPAAGDPDVLMLGDFNSYAKETPISTITAGGFTDLETALLGPSAYSYLFDGQLGHLDYAFSNVSMTPQITGVAAWHINADEANVFDYNDEIKDTGEAVFEEKPDGSALFPPRVVFQAGPYRASDHDPIILGIFPCATLSPATLPGGTAGVAYSQSITASPAAAYVYSVVGALPGNLTLNPATGLLSGSNPTQGTYPITVTATAPGGCSASISYVLVIACAAPTITNTATPLANPGILPGGKLSTAYSGSTFTGTGGTAPYTYAGFGFPSGLSVAPGTGVLSGTPTQAGLFQVTVVATDVNGCPGSVTYFLAISGPPACVASTMPATIQNGDTGSAYSDSVAATGGTAPFQYVITSGALKSGLSLNAATGAITGTPTTTGPWTVTIAAVDANFCFTSQTYSPNTTPVHLITFDLE